MILKGIVASVIIGGSALGTLYVWIVERRRRIYLHEIQPEKGRR